MFRTEEKTVEMGGLAFVRDRDERCGERSPRSTGGSTWTCTRETGHSGVHRGGYAHSNENTSHWGAEWDDDRSTDLTDEEMEQLYG